MKYIKKSPIIFGLLSLIVFFAYAKQEKVLQIFRNGEIIQEYPVDEIDYIEVNDLIGSPYGVSADVSDNQITISWNKVEGAIYSIYRSPDNVNFNLLASNLSETRYTDTKPLKGTNYYKVKAIVNGVESGYSSSAAGTLSDNGLESGIYLGIAGFNEAIYNYPVMQISDSSIDGYYNFIDGLTMKLGTVLYYSVDQAINTLQAAQLPSDLSTAAIVTFTDGLDQGSSMLDDSHEGDMGYLNDINQRIKNETCSGKTITAYSIGLKGNDVKDENMFLNNLKKLASSDANAFEVSNMAEVNAKFKEIAEQLSKRSYIQTINLKMPGVANGTIVRFTFDNVNDAAKSTLYIEGTFNLSARSLENVKYFGMTSTSGLTLKGKQEGIFVNFSIEGVHTDNNTLIDSKFTDEWTYISSNNSWQINSEFDKTENSDVITERSSAAIMLVLDCSSSLGSQFVTAKNNAKDFVNTLYEASRLNGGNNNNEGGNNTGDPNDNSGDNGNGIYSTTPMDLSLAIWKNGERYYLSSKDYKNANLNDAVIEGLTIKTGNESFIMSLEDINSNCKSLNSSLIKMVYKELLPTATQAVTISAKWSDINTALLSFDGSTLKAYYNNRVLRDGQNVYDTYMTLASENEGLFNTNLLSGPGGILNTIDGSTIHVRGVKSTDCPTPIYWKDPRDLKLSVLVDGKREFLSEKQYNDKKNQISEVEGIAVILGGEEFLVKLQNEQTDPIKDVNTAISFYGDELPSAFQGMLLGMISEDLNKAFDAFGGQYINTPSYTLSTLLDSNGHYINCYQGWGTLEVWWGSAPYIRCIKNLKNSNFETFYQSGDGTLSNPYNCEAVINLNPDSTSKSPLGGEDVWVEGYICGTVVSSNISNANYSDGEIGQVNTNLLLVSSPLCLDSKYCITVQLPNNSLRSELNLIDNPFNLWKKVKIKGDVMKYYQAPGLKNITEFKFVE